MSEVSVDFAAKTATVSSAAGEAQARAVCEKALREAGYGIETFRVADAAAPAP